MTYENGKYVNQYSNNFTRFAFDKIRNGEDIRKITNQIREKRKNSKENNNSIITSHDYYVFFERFGNANEFFKYVNRLSINRVLYISITTKKSLKLKTVNSYTKNLNQTIEHAYSHLDKYGIAQLKQYTNEAKIYLDSKRDCDIILELECIYDKEYLRNFLLEHYNWSDTNYDAVYDYYMSKQPYIGD